MWKWTQREAERLVQGHQLARGRPGLQDFQVHVLHHSRTLPLGSWPVALFMNKGILCVEFMLLQEWVSLMFQKKKNIAQSGFPRGLTPEGSWQWAQSQRHSTGIFPRWAAQGWILREGESIPLTFRLIPQMPVTLGAWGRSLGPFPPQFSHWQPPDPLDNGSGTDWQGCRKSEAEETQGHKSNPIIPQTRRLRLKEVIKSLSVSWHLLIFPRSLGPKGRARCQCLCVQFLL